MIAQSNFLSDEFSNNNNDKKKKKNHPRVGVLRILGVLFHFAINFFIVVYKNISL